MKYFIAYYDESGNRQIETAKNRIHAGRVYRRLKKRFSRVWKPVKRGAAWQ